MIGSTMHCGLLDAHVVTVHASAQESGSPSNSRHRKAPSAGMVRDGSRHVGGDRVVVVVDVTVVVVEDVVLVVVDVTVVVDIKDVVLVVVEAGTDEVDVVGGRTGVLQSGSQMSVDGGSHCSPKPGSTTPSPQDAG